METAEAEVVVAPETVAASPPPKREPQLKTITAIENVVNEYARTMAKKYKIKDDEFVILLSRRFKGIMGLQRGHPAQITLPWPDAQPHLNSLLSSAFHQIAQYKMVDIWSIERVMHIRGRNAENKKWRREKFGDLGEIIGELIPKKYINVETTTVSVVTQKARYSETGLIVEKTYTTKVTKHDDGRVLDVKTWLEISRLVRDAEEAEVDDDTTAESEVESTSGGEQRNSEDTHSVE